MVADALQKIEPAPSFRISKIKLGEKIVVAVEVDRSPYLHAVGNIAYVRAGANNKPLSIHDVIKRASESPFVFFDEQPSAALVRDVDRSAVRRRVVWPNSLWARSFSTWGLSSGITLSFIGIAKKRTPMQKVDYIWACQDRIIPLEVRTGTSGSLKSIHLFLEEKGRNTAVRLNMDKPSLGRFTAIPGGKAGVAYTLLSLPLYIADQLDRLLNELLD